MRRAAPRPVELTLESLVGELAPATTLGQVQERWAAVAGAVVAAESEPVVERAGVITVACRSAVWAHELQLLAPELVRGLNESLARSSAPPPVRELRFVTSSAAGA